MVERNQFTRFVETIKISEMNCMEYKKGEIAVWMGNGPAILRISKNFNCKNKIKLKDICAQSTYKPYDSLHFENLRPATQEEIKLLGNNEILFL